MGVLDDLVALERRSVETVRLMVGTPTPLDARCSW
jgi:hypothetical protein